MRAWGSWRPSLADWALPAAILVLGSLIAIAEPAFLSSGNLIGIVRQVALIGIMACCMTFVIMTGGVDLSVGPVLALAGLCAFYALDAGLPLPLVILAGLSAGLAVGLVNGTIVALLDLPPIIVTLATLSVVRGIAFPLATSTLSAYVDWVVTVARGTSSSYSSNAASITFVKNPPASGKTHGSPTSSARETPRLRAHLLCLLQITASSS
jgi:ribose/xylose/arabinose/galactoside ABC-type transport system permease subunit